MTIPFSNIPSNLRVPLFYAELDPSHANTAAEPQRTLLIGQATLAGTAALNTPVQCASGAAARALAGAGSVLADMALRYLANDPNGELWLLPVADAAGATATTRAVTFSGTVAAGTVALYIDDAAVPLTISAGMTLAQIAAAWAVAVNANPDLTVTAAVDAVNTTQVNLTAKNKGALPPVQAAINLRGATAGEVLPSGLGVTIAAAVPGGTNPALAPALAALGDMGFDFIVNSVNDVPGLAATTAMMSDVTGRWSWAQQRFGHVFAALTGSSGTLAAYAAPLNDQHLSLIGLPAGMPTTSWAAVAAFAGAAAASLRQDAAQPLQTVAVAGVMAAPIASRFQLTTRNTLLFAGVSTFTTSHTGAIAIENMVTTYQRNAQGQADNSYLEVETMFTLAFVLRAMRAVVTTKYARVKLAADGTRVAPGSNVVTPSVIKADLIAQYRQLEEAGFVQQSDVFAANLSVEKDANNPNRVNVLWPAILINQLRVFALLAQFRLS